jgi:glycosyltransferase involved in cell wall biosynthesis
LEALVGLFPQSEIFTLLHRPGRVGDIIERVPVHTSFIDRLPLAHTHYRYYLPLFPRAIERFDLTGYDLVISTSHCVAKGAIPQEGAHHLCYCFTPMRYVWDMQDAYFARARLPVSLAVKTVAGRLRRWDVTACNRVDAFVACSHHIRRKIERFYGREASVVYPPVAVERFRWNLPREEFYLIVSALVPYKRIDIAIDAFNRLQQQLIVVGEGTEDKWLRRMARRNITFTGRLKDQEVADLMARCRALVFPGQEEFGITAVEAQAAGAPVIAYAAGGVTESVKMFGAVHESGDTAATGVSFHPQTPEALLEAVRRFGTLDFDARLLRENAERFATENFTRRIRRVVDELLGPTES